jgi:N-acetylneuraminic acid mutarotase
MLMIRGAFSSHRRLAILSLTILFLGAIHAHGQVGYGSWYSVAPSNDYHVYSMVGVVDNTIVAATGTSGGASTYYVEAYDPAGNSWYPKASFNTTPRSTGQGVGIGSKFYAIGGCNGSDCRIGVTNRVDMWDATTNSWSQVASMNVPRGVFAAAEYDGKIYVAGGTSACPDCVGLNSIEVYDPAANTWTLKTPMPNARWGLSSGAALNGKFYVVSGTPNNGGTYYNSMDVYDIATDTWSTLPTPFTSAGSGVVALNGYLYVISGVLDYVQNTTMYIYNPVTNAWSTGNPIPQSRYNLTAHAIGGAIYVVAAADGTGTGTTAGYVYYPNASDPRITGLSCLECTVGETITIYGSNFSYYTYENAVKFNGVDATVVSSAYDYIQVVIPPTATKGLVTVTVGGYMAISPAEFTPIIPLVPSISKIEPESGEVGSTVTIIGENFNEAPEENIVYFGATKATVLAGSATELWVTVPVGATYEPVTLTTNGLTAYSDKPFITTISDARDVDVNSFPSNVGFATQAYPQLFETGDLDGDGKAEVIVANFSSNILSVYKNTGTPGTIDANSLTLVYNLTTGSGPMGVALGDINGDGTLDIAVSNYYYNNVYVYRNFSTPGNFSFDGPSAYTTGSYPIYGLAFEDFDLDGRPDLAFTNYYDYNFSILRNSSTTGFVSFDAKVDYYMGYSPMSLTVGDIDADGKPDVAVVNRDAKLISIWRNKSVVGSLDASSFEWVYNLGTGNTPNFVTLGDLDLDGLPEIVTTNSSDNTLFIYKNYSSAGSVSLSYVAGHNTGSNPHGVTVSDVNGDGRPDITVSHNADYYVSVFQNYVTGGDFSYFYRTDFSAPGNTFDVKVADIDGDGRPDILGTNHELSTLSVWRNTQSTEPVAQPTDFAFADLTTTSYTVSFTPAVGLASGYIVIAKEGSEPTSDPVDGTSYAVGNSIGDGVVVQLGPDTQFYQSDRSPATTYYYKIYSMYYDGFTFDYKEEYPLVGSVTTLSLASSPAYQPTNFTYVPGDSYISVQFTAAADSPEGYIAFRFEGADPGVYPNDGQFYQAGLSIGSATVAYVGSATEFTDLGLNPASPYYYKIFSYNGSDYSTNYLETDPLTAYSSTIAPEPAYQPANFQAVNVTNYTAEISFTPADDYPNAYLVIRTINAYPSSVPVDATGYDIGQTLGDAVVAYIGSGTSFTDSGLLPGTYYYYKVFSLNHGGTNESVNYRTASPLGGYLNTTGSSAPEPLNPATNFSSTPISNTSFTVQFTSGAEAPSGFSAGYLVLRQEGNWPSEYPQDQQSYLQGQILGSSVIAYVGPDLSFIESDMKPGTYYYYRIFSYNTGEGSINYLLTSLDGYVQTGGSPAASEPLYQPVNFNVYFRSANAAGIQFDASADATGGYLVIRRAGAIPTTNPADYTPYTPGTILGDGVVAQVLPAGAVSFLDEGLSPYTDYYYNIYAFNGEADGVNFLVTNPLQGYLATLASEPAAQPTAFTTSSVTNSSYYIYFNGPAVYPHRYFVLRSTSGFPSTDPVDGVEYSLGEALGNAIVVHNFDNTALYESGLPSGTDYFYKIYSVNGTSYYTNYLQAEPLTGIGSTMADEPYYAPTNFNATNITNTTADISFAPAADYPDEYLVIRREGAEPSGQPSDGTGYEPGQALSDGVVAYVGSSYYFTDAGLLPAANYYYHIYSLNRASTNPSINYLQYYPLAGGPVTTTGSRASEPLNAPTNFTSLALSNTSFTVQYDAAADAPSGYIALRREGGWPSQYPPDETIFEPGQEFGDAVVAYAGPDLSFTESGLAPGTYYYYTIFSYNEIDGSVNYLWNPLYGYVLTGGSAPAPEPLSQATDFVVVSRSGNSAVYQFTPSPDAEGYLVVRKDLSPPTTDPSDFISYPLWYSLGDAYVTQILPAGSTGFEDDGMNAGSSYYYKIYAFNGSGEAINYLVANPLQGSVYTLAEEPWASPTSFDVSSVTSSSYLVSFDLAEGNPEKYIALRSSSGYPSSNPSDGVDYSAGQVLGDATVAYIGTATGFFESGLSAGTDYYYKIFSFNGNGGIANYQTIDPLSGYASTRATQPVSQPTSFTQQNVTSNTADISFAPAADSPWGYIAIRKEGSYSSSDPVDGTGYEVGQAIGDGVVAYVGSGTAFNETALLPGSNYYYKIYSLNRATFEESINYLQLNPLTGGAVSTGGSRASEPLNPPTNFSSISLSNTSYTVQYSAAADLPTGYIVFRRQGSQPVTTPVDEIWYGQGDQFGDAVVAYVGSDLTFTETDMMPGTQYFYRIYSYNESSGSVNYLLTPLDGDVLTQGNAPATEPADQASNFEVTARTSNSASITITPGSEPVSGYIVIRKEGAVPGSDPADYTYYTQGETLSDGVVAAVLTTEPYTFVDAGLNSSAYYYYKVYSFNGNGDAVNYFLTNPLEGWSLTLAADPAAQPTNFGTSFVTNTSFVATFNAAAGNPGRYIALRHPTNYPATAPLDGNEYSVGEAISDAVVVFVGTGTEFPQTSLSQNTSYYYAIYSINGSGETTNYLESLPLQGVGTTANLAPEPLSQPTNLSFTDVTHNSYLITFSAAAGNPAGYIGIASTGLPTQPVDGIVYTIGQNLGGGSFVSFIGSQTSYQVNDAPPSTTLNYAVYSYNGEGADRNFRQSNPLTSFVTTEPAPDQTAPTLMLDETPTKVIKNSPVTFRVTLQDNVGVTEAYIDYGPAEKVENIYDWFDDGQYDDSDIKVLTLSNISGNIWQGTAEANDFGNMGLVYLVSAYDANSNEYVSPNSKTVTVEVTGQGFGIPITRVGSDVSKYNIVSVPLVLTANTVNDVFGEALGPYDIEKWRMYRYQSGQNQELSGTSRIDPGKGYWLISTTPATINTGAGTIPSANAENPFTLQLTSGWNQIGNPYTFNLLWQDVRDWNSNLTLGNLRIYNNGSFENGTVLKTYEGGFVMAQNNSSLEFPVVQNPAAGRERTEDGRVKNPIDGDDWEVILNLETGYITNTFSGIGMNKNAREENDGFDDFTMPRFFKYLELNHEKEFINIPFSKDIVPISENHIWTFSVESNADYDNIKISWDNSYFGNSSKQLVLWDITRQRPVDMRRFDSYVFDKHKSRKFMVLFGEDAFIRENIRVNNPLLHEVFPNPVDEKATFAFSVPESSSQQPVQLEVFDLFGKKVSTILNAKIEAGYHEVEWDVIGDNGSKPAAGVYVTYLSIGDKKDQLRIIIVN